MMDLVACNDELDASTLILICDCMIIHHTCTWQAGVAMGLGMCA